MDEKSMLKFIKNVMINGNNPTGDEAINNLKWGLNEFLKTNIKDVLVKAIMFGSNHHEDLHLKGYENYLKTIEKFYKENPELKPKH